MGTTVNDNFGYLIQQQKDAQQAQQAEEKRAQEAKAKQQQSIYNWTGVNTNNFGEGTSIFDNVVGYGQVALAPVTTTLNVGGSMLGGVLGGIGKLLSPIFGFIGGIFGGGGNANQAQGGGGQANGNVAPNNNPGTTAPAQNSTPTTSDSSSSTSSTDNKPAAQKAGATTPTPSTNTTQGTVQKVGSIKTGMLESTLDTGDTEMVSSWSRAMVEEFNDASTDVETLTKARDAKKEERSRLQAENKEKQADRKTALTAKISQFDTVIKNYDSEANRVSANIQGQQKALASCEDATEKARIQSTIASLQAQLETIKEALQDAKAQQAEAKAALEKCDGDAAKSDSTEAKLANLDAEIAALEHQITTAQARKDEAKRVAETEAKNEARNNIDKAGALKANEHQEEFNRQLDKDEKDAATIDFANGLDAKASSKYAHLDSDYTFIKNGEEEIQVKLADGKLVDANGNAVKGVVEHDGKVYINGDKSTYTPAQIQSARKALGVDVLNDTLEISQNDEDKSTTISMTLDRDTTISKEQIKSGTTLSRTYDEQGRQICKTEEFPNGLTREFKTQIAEDGTISGYTRSFIMEEGPIRVGDIACTRADITYDSHGQQTKQEFIVAIGEGIKQPAGLPEGVENGDTITSTKNADGEWSNWTIKPKEADPEA